jgi:hypothetical protein
MCCFLYGRVLNCYLICFKRGLKNWVLVKYGDNVTDSLSKNLLLCYNGVGFINNTCNLSCSVRFMMNATDLWIPDRFSSWGGHTNHRIWSLRKYINFFIFASKNEILGLGLIKWLRFNDRLQRKWHCVTLNLKKPFRSVLVVLEP